MIKPWMFVPKRFVTATGGTITYDGDYKIHTFLSSANFIVTAGGDVEYLVVAGGGAGASGTPSYGSGGGGGEVEAGSGKAVTPQTYSIIVGDGATTPPLEINGSDGDNSIFSDITATGGKGAIATGAGGDSGSGYTGGTGGGVGIDYAGGGGAGDSENGGNAAFATFGAAGVGTSNSITGSAVEYGMGADGNDETHHAGADGTDGLGEGARPEFNGAGKQGGSGLVILRYKYK